MRFSFDQFTLDTDRFELRRAGVVLAAEPQVIELLALLLENRGRLVSRDEINEIVWRGRIVSDAALSSRIKTARQLLGDDGRSQRYIRTIHKKGFRFVADVTVVAGDDTPVCTPATADDEASARSAGSGLDGDADGWDYGTSTAADDAIKVQFFNHAGGQSVAYSVSGSGPPLVVPAWWVSHLELDWQQPGFRQFFSALGQHHRVIRYDRPGVGLSDRQRDSFTMDDEVSVLTGLIDHLQLAECALLGISCGGPVSVIYTALNPQRVSKLVLLGSFVHGADIAPPPVQDAICSLVSAHWGLGAKAIIDLFIPEMAADSRNAMGKVHRRSASPEMATALLQLTFAMDARDAAQGLQVPALVIHRNRDQTVTFDAGRRLASYLGNAQLLTLEGRAHLPWFGEQSRDIVEHVLQFTGVTQGTANADNAGQYQFRQQGDTWSLQFGAAAVHLKDSLGLHDLAFLLAHPRQDIHVMKLYGDSETVLQQSESPLLDTSALRQLRARLADIEEQKTVAAASDNDAAYQRLENEQDKINKALRQGLGLGGRQRLFDGAAEKARKAISARVRATIKRIDAVNPELAAHLQSSIRTGNYCSYCPEQRPDWQL